MADAADLGSAPKGCGFDSRLVHSSRNAGGPPQGAGAGPGRRNGTGAAVSAAPVRCDVAGSGYLPALANFAKRRLNESMRPSVSTNVFLPV